MGFGTPLVLIKRGVMYINYCIKSSIRRFPLHLFLQYSILTASAKITLRQVKSKNHEELAISFNGKPAFPIYEEV
jgi:hypothetical protein